MIEVTVKVHCTVILPDGILNRFVCTAEDYDTIHHVWSHHVTRSDVSRSDVVTATVYHDEDHDVVNGVVSFRVSVIQAVSCDFIHPVHLASDTLDADL